MKKYLGLGFILIIPLFLAGCKLTSLPAQDETAQNEITAKPVGCGSNESCANELLKTCAMGSYVYGLAGSSFERLYAIKGHNPDGTCNIEWGYLKAEYPLKDLRMTCAVPAGIQTPKQVDDYIFQNKFSNCAGPLKDAVIKPVSQIPPEPTTQENICQDAACANQLLEKCARGTFSVKRIRNNKTTEITFALTSQPYEGVCLADVKITQSPQENLIGPKMECALKQKIQTLFDIQNFITDKFSAYESNSFSTCTGELYQLVKDIEL